MLEAFYATERGSLEDATINGGFDLHPELVWLDLIAPSQEEQQWVLDAYNQNLPTLKSLEDISSSARFYRDDDGILHISTYFNENKIIRLMGMPKILPICLPWCRLLHSSYIKTAYLLYVVKS